MDLILYNDATSPFGRKIMVAAIERGLPVEERFVNLADAGHLDAYNPLRQIPILVTAGGLAIYDSNVIFEFFGALPASTPLIPPAARVECLTRVALADGLMEATLQRRIETLRPPAMQSADVIGVREARIGRVITALEATASRLGSTTLNADEITVGCALGYLDFRYGTSWRAAAPQLSAWYAGVAERRSFIDTAPTRTSPATIDGAPAASRESIAGGKA